MNISRELGHPSKIVESVVEVNNAQKQRAYGKIRDILGGDLKGKVIAILGLAFKPNTDDFRESPAEVIVNGIRKEGGTVRAFDPAAMQQARDALGEEGITFCENSYDAVKGADVMVVVTEWNQFRLLNLGKCKDLLKTPNLVDLRNVYEPEAVRALGFTYTSIGRV